MFKRLFLSKLFQVFTLAVLAMLMLTVAAQAQDVVAATPAKSTIMHYVLGAVQGLWGIFGATLTVMITSMFNTVVKAYVPREVQIPLAGILSAILATLGGGDPTTAMVMGSSTQTALSLSPPKFLASAPLTSTTGG